MDLIVKNTSHAAWGDTVFRAAIGLEGVSPADLKHEGDKKTPLGRFPIREVLYRADRVPKPSSCFKTRALKNTDAWCERPDDPQYNRLVALPYEGADPLWREDHVYDVVVVLGHNDDPVVPGAGSAIFLHLARPDFSGSAGCITLALEDLLTVLREAEPGSAVQIEAT